MENNLDIMHLASVRSEKKRYIEIPALSVYPELIQGFTTRLGGVSSGDYASLNLNFNRPDPKSNVLENYRLLGQELQIPLEHMVLSHQVHDNKVLQVTEEHAGMGIIRERSYSNIDGLATSGKNLLLVTHYADCVPLYFYDPAQKVIALAHSGWKGTLLDIAGETVNLLKTAYGCKPENIHAAFGPHIRSCCFEVDLDVAESFRKAFPWAKDYSVQRKDGKWLLDLEGIIAQSLLTRGVTKISGCRVCTRCNKDLFFSHRGMHGRTGTGAAFMMIRG